MLTGQPGFVGRQQEMGLLLAEYRRDRPSLLVMYGRRRVGKSTLLLRSLQAVERPGVYFQASLLADADNLALLKATLRDQIALSTPQQTILASLADWLGLVAGQPQSHL